MKQISDSHPLVAGAEGVSVKPGQRGIAYHYTVRCDASGYYGDAYDLQDALALAEAVALHNVKGATILCSEDGSRVQHVHYFDASLRRKQKAALEAGRDRESVLAMAW